MMGGRGAYSLTSASGRKRPVISLRSARATAGAAAIVAKEKITEYLLKKRERDDKSGFFVGVLGYSPDEPERLAADLIEGLKGAAHVATSSGKGGIIKENYEMELGIARRAPVTTIWERRKDGSLRLITAYPSRRE